MKIITTIIYLALFAISSIFANGLTEKEQIEYFTKNYKKSEVRIEMRDGISLYTVIYEPIDNSTTHPIMFRRTPYSNIPYGKDLFPNRRLNSWFHFIKENYIIVSQDVRGRFMSEGEYINMRPYISDKSSNKDIDESSDAYDSIEWLISNLENNNGNVGIWGTSYPGFYAAMAAIDAHPALKAVSPQAPIADWFIGDDMHHNGAFSLLLNFNFFDVFGIKRDSLTTSWPKGIEYPSQDAYNFFLELGSLQNINKKYFKNNIPFFDSTVAHPNYDEYWQSKNTRRHFNDIKPAVMTVGGWYDGEDLFGALQTYSSIEENNKINQSSLIMGPWYHGGWTRSESEFFGDMNFGSKTGNYYINNIELPFFNYHLKGKEKEKISEAMIFNTGANKWHSFEKYPPEGLVDIKLYLGDKSSLLFQLPTNDEFEFDEYMSDPNKPVPYTSKIQDSQKFYNKEYMVEDQRFASSRPDVLVYESITFEKDITIVGPIDANLFVSTSGTDSDWIVKVIDVFPDDEKDPDPNPNNVKMGGYEMLVRGEILRGKYRNSFEYPEPFEPNKVTEVNFKLNDVCHTFKKGHKIMVQIQSSWFPLFDRNPQSFVNIYEAKEKDFKKATQRIFHTNKYLSNLSFSVLN